MSNIALSKISITLCLLAFSVLAIANLVGVINWSWWHVAIPLMTAIYELLFICYKVKFKNGESRNG